jgi:hypothetical protein
MAVLAVEAEAPVDNNMAINQRRGRQEERQWHNKRLRPRDKKGATRGGGGGGGTSTRGMP